MLIAGAELEHRFFDVADVAMARVRTDGCLIAHTIAETYSRLTSSAFDWTGRAADEYLGRFLERAPVGLSPERYPQAVRDLIDAGVTGAAVYDGLIALAAREAGLTLVSLDRRARPTYDRCGVDYELLLHG